MFNVNVTLNDKYPSVLQVCNALTKLPRTYSSEEEATMEIMSSRFICCIANNNLVIVPQHSVLYITFDKIEEV